MAATLTLFLLIAFFFVLLKFTRLNHRIEFLEDQIRLLKSELSNLRQSKTVFNSSAEDMPTPASTSQPSTVSPDTDQMILRHLLQKTSRPGKEQTLFTKPWRFRLQVKFRQPPAPPPPIIEQPSIPSAP